MLHYQERIYGFPEGWPAACRLSATLEATQPVTVRSRHA